MCRVQASYGNHLDVAKALIAASAKIEVTDSNGGTALVRLFAAV
jgi:hypothetical protein